MWYCVHSRNAHMIPARGFTNNENDICIITFCGAWYVNFFAGLRRELLWKIHRPAPRHKDLMPKASLMQIRVRDDAAITRQINTCRPLTFFCWISSKRIGAQTIIPAIRRPPGCEYVALGFAVVGARVTTAVIPDKDKRQRAYGD